MRTNTRAIGEIGEQTAAEYLKKAGYKILERNAVYCDCEVDIICECYTDTFGTKVPKPKLFSRKKGVKTLVFCEVKTRASASFGTGAEAVTKYKVGRYITAAKAYCSRRAIVGTNVRFDIIEVVDGEVNHIQNAFGYDDAKYYKSSY